MGSDVSQFFSDWLALKYPNSGLFLKVCYVWWWWRGIKCLSSHTCWDGSERWNGNPSKELDEGQTIFAQLLSGRSHFSWRLFFFLCRVLEQGIAQPADYYYFLYHREAVYSTLLTIVLQTSQESLRKWYSMQCRSQARLLSHALSGGRRQHILQ